MENERKKKYSVGVDIGGTNIHVALVDSDGKIVRQERFATRDHMDVNDFVAHLSSVILDQVQSAGVAVIDRSTGKVSGSECNVIGIGVAAPSVNSKTRCIENPARLPWRGITPLAYMLEASTGLPVWLANDANAATIGEMVYGCARGMENFIVITLGTGVGSGIVVDGHLLNGTHGFAGELGHMTFGFAADRHCGCGRNGCMETCCNASGVVETARRMMNSTDTPSVLRELTEEQLTAKAIGEALLAGDELAAKVFHFTEDAMGRAFAEFCAFCDPEAIILFGGVADPRELNADHIKEVMDEHMLYLYRDTKVLFSILPGADAAILGAASLPWQNK